jgi:hypothetical protein
MTMDAQGQERAKTMLRSVLERVLGPKLPGIAGYGVGVDYKTRELGLNVKVSVPKAATRIGRELPSEIGGLPVRISVAGPARLDRAPA